MQIPQHWCSTSGLWDHGDENVTGNAICYDVKPVKDADPKVFAFNEQQWSHVRSAFSVTGDDDK